jgi:hypothetical protein
VVAAAPAAVPEVPVSQGQVAAVVLVVLGRAEGVSVEAVVASPVAVAAVAASAAAAHRAPRAQYNGLTFGGTTGAQHWRDAELSYFFRWSRVNTEKRGRR